MKCVACGTLMLNDFWCSECGYDQGITVKLEPRNQQCNYPECECNSACLGLLDDSKGG